MAKIGIAELVLSAVLLCTGLLTEGGPPAGQTLSELKGSVSVTVDNGLIPGNGLSGYDNIPGDIEGIIHLSAWRWMGYVFTELEQNGEPCPELEDFECTQLSLLDISEEGNVFVYRAEYQFLPKSDSDAGFWMAGNTAPCEGREGWYRFARQIAVGREGDAWEVLTVGTGGVRADAYADYPRRVFYSKRT